jgi:hypothetical protein
MHLAERARLRFPYAGRDHPGAHRFLADLDAVTLGQLLAGERRPEVVPLRLFQQFDGARLGLGIDLPVRRPASQTVHDNGVAIGLHPCQ